MYLTISSKFAARSSHLRIFFNRYIFRAVFVLWFSELASLSQTAIVSAISLDSRAFGSASALISGQRRSIPDSGENELGDETASVFKPVTQFGDGTYNYTSMVFTELGARKNEITTNARGCDACAVEIRTSAGAKSFFEDDLIFVGSGAGSVTAKINVQGTLGSEVNSAVDYTFRFDAGDELNVSGDPSGSFLFQNNTGSFNETLTVEFDYTFNFNRETAVSFTSDLNVSTSTFGTSSVNATAKIESLIVTNGPLPEEPSNSPELQKVGLAWGVDVPRAYSAVTDAAGNVNSVTAAGTTSAASVDAATRADIKSRLGNLFSGVENVAIVDGFVEGGTNVYFANPFGTSLLGQAFTGIDQFNERLEDGVAVFLTGGNELDAEVAAHELGHAFGLRHVNPSATDDPQDLSLMDYDDALGDTEEFINAVSEIMEPPSDPMGGTGVTHNPFYHISRYIDGYSHQDLTSFGITAGDWDLSAGAGGSASRVNVQLDFNETDLELYDVSILVGESDRERSLSELDSFSVLSLTELEQLTWELDEETRFRLLAASSPGGELDIILAADDPFDASNVGVQSVVGNQHAGLQLVTDPLGGFTTLVPATLRVTLVPEPSTLIMLLLLMAQFPSHRRGVRADE